MAGLTLDAGPAANGLKPLQHLDRGGIIITAALRQSVEQVVGHRVYRGCADRCGKPARLLILCELRPVRTGRVLRRSR